jgi:hypothetical protein
MLGDQNQQGDPEREFCTTGNIYSAIDLAALIHIYEPLSVPRNDVPDPRLTVPASSEANIRRADVFFFSSIPSGRWFPLQVGRNLKAFPALS